MEQIAEQVRAYNCSCNKCEIEMIWNRKKIRVTSPQVCAGIHRASRKSMRLDEIQLYLYASESKTRTSDKILAIRDFHQCPNLLGFLEQFSDWQKAIQKVREEIQESYEKAKILHFGVRNWEGRLGKLEKSPETTIGEIKEWMKEFFGKKSWISTKQFIINRRVVGDDETIGGLGVSNGDVLRCM